MGGVAGSSFGRLKIIYLQISNAAWTSSLDTAVVIRILFPVILLQRNLFIFLQSVLMHRGHRRLLRSDRLFMETVPESCRCTNRMKSTKLSLGLRSSVHVQILAIKRVQRRVHNPLSNSSPAEWDNCRSLRQVVLDFTVLRCSDQLVCFIIFEY